MVIVLTRKHGATRVPAMSNPASGPTKLGALKAMAFNNLRSRRLERQADTQLAARYVDRRARRGSLVIVW
jgi:hypothetical protein